MGEKIRIARFELVFRAGDERNVPTTPLDIDIQCMDTLSEKSRGTIREQGVGRSVSRSVSRLVSESVGRSVGWLAVPSYRRSAAFRMYLNVNNSSGRSPGEPLASRAAYEEKCSSKQLLLLAWSLRVSCAADVGCVFTAHLAVVASFGWARQPLPLLPPPLSKNLSACSNLLALSCFLYL